MKITHIINLLAVKTYTKNHAKYWKVSTLGETHIIGNASNKYSVRNERAVLWYWWWEADWCQWKRHVHWQLHNRVKCKTCCHNSHYPGPLQNYIAGPFIIIILQIYSWLMLYIYVYSIIQLNMAVYTLYKYFVTTLHKSEISTNYMANSSGNVKFKKPNPSQELVGPCNSSLFRHPEPAVRWSLYSRIWTPKPFQQPAVVFSSPEHNYQISCLVAEAVGCDELALTCWESNQHQLQHKSDAT